MGPLNTWGLLLSSWGGSAFPLISFSLFVVPGGIASESLTFTPLDDMIFLKWEEPVEPNGLITQYEVGSEVPVHAL